MTLTTEDLVEAAQALGEVPEPEQQAPVEPHPSRWNWRNWP